MNRLTTIALAALVLPLALGAQQPTAPTADPVTGSFKVFSSRYGSWLVAAFDSIPASRYGFKPTPVQQSVGYIAQHLESANYGLCSQFGGAPRQMTSRDSLADTVKAMWPKDTLVSRLRASVAYCDAALGTVSDARLADPIVSGPAGAQRSTPRARFMLGYVADLVDHYSQIAVYMRLNGMVPPSSLPRPRS
jgi:uncharacterized damage-inducible protein DinB